MRKCISVKFKETGKAYYFDANNQPVQVNDQVIVETVRGLEYGIVAAPPRDVTDQEADQYKKLVRIATEEDIRKVKENRRKAKQAFTTCEEKILQHKLDMKLVDVEYTFDGSKIIFCFTADGRIDFRELVKDLASVFKTRIELRQIGVRDETKMLGGLGPCGLECCCASFLADFQPVSIKMAKEQGLSLNPTKISGLCGRLMCCLKYEQSFYEQEHKRLPKPGTEVIVPDGKGLVVESLPIKDSVKVSITTQDNITDIREYPFSEVKVSRPPQKKEPASGKEKATDKDKKKDKENH